MLLFCLVTSCSKSIQSVGGSVSTIFEPLGYVLFGRFMNISSHSLVIEISAFCSGVYVWHSCIRNFSCTLHSILAAPWKYTHKEVKVEYIEIHWNILNHCKNPCNSFMKCLPHRQLCPNHRMHVDDDEPCHRDHRPCPVMGCARWYINHVDDDEPCHRDHRPCPVMGCARWYIHCAFINAEMHAV